MFRTNLTTDWDMDICRLVFEVSRICKTQFFEKQYTPPKKRMHISTKVFFKQPKEIFHIVLFFVENALVWQQIKEKGGS